VAAATSARIVVLVFGPHQRRHALALCPELLFRGEGPAHLADDVLGAGHGLVPEQFGVLPGNVAVVARGAHAGAGRAVDALAVLLGHPLHRVTRRPAERVGACDVDHHLGADDGDGTEHDAHADERQQRPAGARAAQAPPGARQQAGSAGRSIRLRISGHSTHFAGGGGGMSTTGTVGLNAGSRSASWPCRAKSIDSPRMRAASCGAWKPVEFSASTKSR